MNNSVNFKAARIITTGPDPLNSSSRSMPGTRQGEGCPRPAGSALTRGPTSAGSKAGFQAETPRPLRSGLESRSVRVPVAHWRKTRGRDGCPIGRRPTATAGASRRPAPAASMAFSPADCERPPALRSQAADPRGGRPAPSRQRSGYHRSQARQPAGLLPGGRVDKERGFPRQGGMGKVRGALFGISQVAGGG